MKGGDRVRIFQGKELEVHNAAMRAKNPGVCRMLEWVYCCCCVHRGKYRGCEYNQVPLTVDNRACPLFRPWYPYTHKEILADIQPYMQVLRDMLAANEAKAKVENLSGG